MPNWKKVIVSGSDASLNSLVVANNVTISGSLANGSDTLASGSYSHAEGAATTSSGDYSHAEGFRTKASGSFSHAEGNSSFAIGSYSHAEGTSTQANGTNAHSEGQNTNAAGDGSHSEGSNTQASGDSSHTEGVGTNAIGGASHAEGESTLTIGYASHAEGYYTVASGSYQHVQGQYNQSSSAQSAFIIGNGTSDAARSNLVFASGSTFQITGSLNVTAGITGSLYGTSSYATTSLTASNALTASYVQNAQTASYVTLAQTASYYDETDPIFVSKSGSFATTGSNFFNGNQTITGSLNVTQGITGSALLITGSTTTDLVRITQTGTGNAFVVEDSTNPDTTPFVIDTSGNVGIGTSTPSRKLSVNGVFGVQFNDATELFVVNPASNGTDFAILNTSSITEFRVDTRAGQQQFWYNGGNFTIGSSANDGINKLQVIGSARITQGITGSALQITGSTTTDLVRITQTGTGNAFVVEDSTNPDSTPFVVSNAGNVAIGITSPSRLLHTSGSTNGTSVPLFEGMASSEIRFLTIKRTDSTAEAFINYTGADLAFGANGIERLRIGRYGDIAIGTAASAPGARLYLTGNDDGNIIRTTPLLIASASSNTDLVRFTQTGTGNSFVVEDTNTPDSSQFVINNVGDVSIGNTTPNAKLDVNGNTIITGSLNVTAGITGSLFGTASWSVNAVTASYSLTASYVNPLNQDVVITGSLNITSNITGSGLRITGSTSNDLVKITQTGAGNAFVVEDSASPDSTLFVINSSGSVGIGMTPTHALDVNGSLWVETYGVSTVAVEGWGINGTGVRGTGQNYGGEFFSRTIGVKGYIEEDSGGIGVYGSVSDVEGGSGDYIGGKFVSVPVTYGNKYSVQLQDGTEGIGKVLVSQTADGKANWSTKLSGAYEITGSLAISGSVIGQSGNTISSDALVQASLLYLSNNF